MIKRSSITTNQTKKYINNLVGDTSYNISESGLRIGIEIDTGGRITGNMSDYFNVRASFDNNYLDTSKFITLEPWDDDFYDGIYSQENINNFKNPLNPLLCIPKNESLDVILFQGGEDYRKFIISFEKCSEYTSSNCADDQTMEELVPSTRIRYHLKSKYFDFTDIDNPVKFFAREEIAYMQFYTTKISYMTIKKNEYHLVDDPFGFSEEDGTFYSFDRFQNDIIDQKRIEGYYKSVYAFGEFSISEEIEIYERSVFSFLDLTGQIGGIYELLEVLAGIFVGYYNTKLFNYTFINKYNSVMAENDKKENENANGNNQNDNENEESKLNIFHNVNSNARNENAQVQPITRKKITYQQYNTSELIRSFTCCWWFGRKSKRGIGNIDFQLSTHENYLKQQKQMDEYLDCINIITNLK